MAYVGRFVSLTDTMYGKKVAPYVQPEVHTDLGVDAARFSFHDLCVASVGRAVPCILAEKFHAILIDAALKGMQDPGAELCRFDSLTDIMCGKKDALYMQSEVHTDQIYAEDSRSADVELPSVHDLCVADMGRADYSTLAE